MDDMIFVRRDGNWLVFACALTGKLREFPVRQAGGNGSESRY